MKLFKTVDEKFEEIGYTKISEHHLEGVKYKRKLENGDTQIISIRYGFGGEHSVIKSIGQTNNAITVYEMKLCIKKIKQMGWKI